MTGLIDKIQKSSISRRNFLKGSAVAASALGLSACGGENKLTELSAADKIKDENGKWIPVACWHNCGGRCLNKALVVDGIVVRQKTDDTHPDSPDYSQFRSCVRGRSQRHQVFGADRLKYPMKRKHWAPGGGDKSLRGKDEWVRISWDEALDILASELKRVKENYGNRAILSSWFNNIFPMDSWDTYSDETKGVEIGVVLNKFGGCVAHFGTASAGSWHMSPYLVGYGEPFYAGLDFLNDRFDARNCQTVIMIGLNPAWSAPGTTFYTNYLPLKKAGAKFISIDPFYNDTANVLDADWIQVRPATDTAFLMAVAHTLITEDDPITNPLIDWDFLNRCTIGFDADSMPEGADPKDNFKDHILGTYDGVPKTPEWASEICGADPEQIRYVARSLRKDDKVALLAGWAPGRNNNTDNLPQIFMAIGAMTGHIGKSGHMTAASVKDGGLNGGPGLVEMGDRGLPYVKNPVDDAICDPDIWPAVLEGKYNYTGMYHLQPGEVREIDIQFIYHHSLAVLQRTEGMTKGIEAHRKVEFVVTHAQMYNPNAQYSDLVLPVTTEWEKFGTLTKEMNRENLFLSSQVTEPLFEAKSDQWIAIELCKRLGINQEELFPYDVKQQHFNEIAGSAVLNEDGETYEPLVTITEKDIAEWGVKGTPQKGRITLKEFREKGVYQVQRSPGDNYGYIAYKNFREDPENNPMASTSGKMEFYSTGLAETINAMGYSKVSPVPTHIPPIDGYEATFSDWDKKVKGEYPYQLYNPHYLRTAHSVLNNVPWLREAWKSPVFINTKDAEDKGVKDGDTVRLFNQNGQTLRNVCTTDRLMPGVIGLPHGGWVDIDEKLGIDVGGADNMLKSPVATGLGVSGYNTQICDFEKWNGKPLMPDAEKPPKVIF